MSHPEPTPGELAELFALDKDIAALCGRLLSELNGGRDRAEVASVVLANSRKSEGQGLLHALVQQHMSLVLRTCARHEQADAWQEEALELFARHKAFIDRASLLAHALADRWFDAKRFSKAESWRSVRSLRPSALASIYLGWLTPGALPLRRFRTTTLGLR